MFFDTGENSHLIDGDLASKELQLISRERTKLGLIAGGQVESEFGKFRFNLGPGEDEKYHEITAVGMKDVTTEFGKYDLEEINQEFLNNASSAEKNYILPKTVGGPKVHLLYGIRKTKIQPVLIKVLPSGVGVYLSPFKDVEGSRIIYAGPSKWVTWTDDDLNRESNHAVYTVSCTDITEGSYKTKVGGEPRFEPKSKVGISPLVGMTCPKYEDVKLSVIDDTLDIPIIESYDMESEGLELIDFKDFSKPEPGTTDFSEPKPELELIDFRDFSKIEPETTDYTEPEPELEVIDFKKIYKHEPKTTDFSDPEPEFEYLS